MDSVLAVVCTIAFGNPADYQECTRPMTESQARSVIEYRVQHPPIIGPDWMLYTLSPPGSETNRVIVHWDGATADDSDTWSGALSSDRAIGEIDHYAHQKPLRFINPVTYDLIRVTN